MAYCRKMNNLSFFFFSRMAYCWDLRAPEPIRKFQLEGTSFPWINSV